MKFLLDVHISFKIQKFLIHDCHCEAIHINNILNGFYSSDDQIASFADQNGLTVITKDIDFRNTYFLKQTPSRIIRVCLGNINNQDLIRLLKKHWSTIEKIHRQNTLFYCEISHEGILLTN